MSSARGGLGGIAVVVLLGVVALIALLALAAATLVASASPAGTTQSVSNRLPGFGGDDIPEPYRLHIGGTVYGEASELRRIVVTTTAPPGPRPSDFPFGANVPIWTDPSAQSRPSMAVDSTGRIYVAFDHDAGSNQYDVYVTWSDDDGLSWMTPIAIADTTANEGNASLVITTGDRVTVFYDSDTTTAINAFFFSDSDDRGTTWTVHSVDFGSTAPFRDLRFPSFASTGAGVYGMYEIWYTGTGASSVIMISNEVITSTGTWIGWYIAQDPDVELFHPASGYSPAGTGLLVGAVAVEIHDGTAYDLTWFRYDPATEYFHQDFYMCGSMCPSEQIPYPSISIDGIRGVVGAEFLNTTVLGPNRIILAAYSENVAAGWDWNQTRDAGGGLMRIDAATVGQEWVHFSLNGTQALAGYWKEGATWYVASANGGKNWEQPYKVSDNSPGSTIGGGRAIATANSAGGPLLAWQDSRAMNPDIYFAGIQTPVARVTLDTVPANLFIRFDGGAWQHAPLSAYLPLGSRHAIEARSPEPGVAGVRYVFANWNDSTTELVKTITVTANVTYTAFYVTQYYTTIATSPVPLSVSVDGVTHAAPFTFWCDEGTTITVYAPSPQSTGPTERYRFDHWTDGGAQGHTLACDGPKVVTAYYVRQFLTVLMTNPAGLEVSVDTVPCSSGASFWFDEGSLHFLDSPAVQPKGANTQYVFRDWEGGPTTTAWSVVITGATTYTANYQTLYLVTLDTSPTDLNLDVDGTQFTAPEQFWWDEDSIHVATAPSPQPGPSGTRYIFLEWSDGDTSPSKTIVVDAPTTVTAVYERQYFLTMTANVGTVSPLSGWYDEGDVVAISATPPPSNATERYSFGGWSGDYIEVSPTGLVTMDRPKTLRANWIHEFRIDVQSTTPGQTVQVDSAAITTPAVLWWAEGSSHTLTATASVSLGPEARCDFTSWNGGVTTEELTVTDVSGSVAYTAFCTKEFRVTVITSPAGRTVLVDGAPYMVPIWFEEGSQHSFDAGSSPQAGGTGTRYVFRSWDTGSTTALRLLTVTSPLTIATEYDTQYQLTIDSPYGDPACQGATDEDGCWYLAGTPAQIAVASPFTATNGTRYALAGWSGDASGTGTSVSLTMDGPKSVTASWQEIEIPAEPGPPIVPILALVGAAIALAGAGAVVLIRRKGSKPKPPSGEPDTNGPA